MKKAHLIALILVVLFSAQVKAADDYPYKNSTPDTVDPWNFYIRECTSYVAWRMNRDAGSTTSPYWFTNNSVDGASCHWGNAENWDDNAASLGFVVDSVPQVGDIAQWNASENGALSGGHVAYVEQVNGDGSVNVSEYNWTTAFAYDLRSNIHAPRYIHVTKFHMGDYVQANSTVNVRATAGGAYLGQETAGQAGTITGGPTGAVYNGTFYKWYNVSWVGLTGWSVESGLTKSADTTSPTVSAFSVTPTSLTLGNSFTISYTVSDTGGSGLNRVELWRANDSGGSPAGWAEILPERTSLSGNGPVSGSFSDAPSSTGTYWYGMHVVDNAGKWNDEKNSNTGGLPGVYGPIKVTVNPQPAISVTPVSRDFGSVQVGSYADGTFTVQNVGGGTLSGSASTSAPFSIASGGTYNLSAGQSQTVTVRFSPTAAQSYSQNVSFTGGSGATRPVSGSGYLAPAISVTPASRDFGSVQVGSYADGTFTVQNTGGGTLSGSASTSAPFSIVSGGTYNLSAGQSQTVTVRFSPPAAQSYSQNVTFTGGGGTTRPVSGSGYNPPAISVTPVSRDFGSVQVGSYADLTFTVQNTGGGTLTGGASVPSPFSIVSGGSYSLGAGQSQVVTVRFSPPAAQSYSQNVTFTGGGGATRPVSGSGYNPPAISVTPSSRDFGSVQVGSYADGTFTVQNAGGGTLSGSASTSAPFSIVSGGTYNLSAGQSQTVTVRFSPTAAQSYNGTVTFTGGGGATRPVSGTGLLQKYMITATFGENGTVEPNGVFDVNLGQDVTFTAEPNAGYIVDWWYLDGSEVQQGSTTYTLYNVQADHNVLVTFIEIPPMDLNNDGIVNFSDFAIFAFYWMDDTCSEPDWCEGSDSDYSGRVDFVDLLNFVDYWLEGTGD